MTAPALSDDAADPAIGGQFSAAPDTVEPQAGDGLVGPVRVEVPQRLLCACQASWTSPWGGRRTRRAPWPGRDHQDARRRPRAAADPVEGVVR
jgi:hypothetical protein